MWSVSLVELPKGRPGLEDGSALKWSTWARDAQSSVPCLWAEGPIDCGTRSGVCVRGRA
jgi:hypothetical protein